MGVRHVPPIAAVLVLAACNGDEAGREARPDQNLQSVPAGNAGRGSADVAATAASGDEVSSNATTNDELRWNASTTSRGEKLSYGKPQTDDVRAALRCASGGKVTVQVFPSKRAERPGQMSVSAGGATDRMAAEVTESMLGGLIVGGDLERDSRVLGRFRNGQPMTVNWGSHSVTVPAQSAEISTFFDRCG